MISSPSAHLTVWALPYWPLAWWVCRWRWMVCPVWGMGHALVAVLLVFGMASLAAYLDARAAQQPALVCPIAI